MEKFRTRPGAPQLPHYLYDLSLPLPERKYKRMLFPSAVAAAVWLGVSPQRIYLSRTPGHRIWSETQGRWFAVRIANPNKITA